MRLCWLKLPWLSLTESLNIVVVLTAATVLAKYSYCATAVCLRVQLHWDNKHPKLPFDATACEDLHAKTGGVTTQGVAVRGSLKK
jgi:hypothetical protein